MKIYMEDNLCTTYKLVFNRLHEFFKKNDQFLVTNPKNADLIIAGLCAAFEADESRSLKIISLMKKFNKPIYAYGCLTKVSPWKIKAEKLFHSWEQKKLAESIVKEPKVSWQDIIHPTGFRRRSDYRIYNPKKRFIAISTGCSFDCSYCPHKIGSGDIVSRKPAEILQQIAGICADGTDTIVLTGIDTACYGKDIGASFPDLLGDILDKCGKDIKLHIAQYNPEGLLIGLEKMIRCCQDSRITDIQLPLQTSSRRLLRLMNRNYSKELVRKFVESVRKKNKRVIFRTDLMVGFPTETQKELESSIDFVASLYDEAAIYSFELKQNTRIASSRLKFLDSEEITRRFNYALDKLRSLGLLVHSGGQDISTLLKADKIKEKIRTRKGRAYEEQG